MISDKRIALDFEGVCADTLTTTIEQSDALTRENSLHSWGWDDPALYDEFMAVSQEVCETLIEEVDPCDPNLADHIAMLRESHEVHILTNRDGADEQLQRWFEIHGIEYDGFRSNPPSTRKAGFEKSADNPAGFDFFIDDNPGMAYEVNRLFLVDQPWNQHVDADGEQVIRVGDWGEDALLEVLNELYAGPIRE